MAEEKQEKHADEHIILLNQIIDEAKKHKFAGHISDDHVDFELSSEYEHKGVKCKVKLSFYIQHLKILDPETGVECGPLFEQQTVKSFGRPKIWRSSWADVGDIIQKLKQWQEIMEGYAGEYHALKDEILYEADADYDPSD